MRIRRNGASEWNLVRIDSTACTMAYFDEESYELDERGLNGFEREALDFLDGFLENLLAGARVYRLTGQDVMCLHQVRQVLLDFGRVDYEGHVRICALRDDGIGTRMSVLEITPHLVVIGVQGIETAELDGASYHDIYFSIGEGLDSETLDQDLDAWEAEFFDKLTHPGSKVTVEGEISNIRESDPRISEDEADSSQEEF